MKPTPEPIDVLAEAERTVREQGRAVLCQVVRADGSTPGKLGWKLLVRPDGTTCGNLGGGAFEAMVTADARAKNREAAPAPEVKRYYLTEEATKGAATGMVCGGLLEVLLEPLSAPPMLVVCGGGPVGQAVARVGAIAGFDLLVADDRAEFRDPALFPPDTRFAEVGREYGEAFLADHRERELWVTVVSRCWETDSAALASVLEQELPRLVYVGLMGSERKIARVKQEVEDRGHTLDDVPLHAPIGLPIGGDSPGEIAVSVLAEIVELRTAMKAAVTTEERRADEAS